MLCRRATSSTDHRASRFLRPASRIQNADAFAVSATVNHPFLQFGPEQASYGRALYLASATAAIAPPMKWLWLVNPPKVA